MGIPSKLLIGAALLFIVIIAVVCGIYLARPAYNYYRRSPASMIWNGVEFKLPPPWFRRGDPGTGRKSNVLSRSISMGKACVLLNYVEAAIRQ